MRIVFLRICGIFILHISFVYSQNDWKKTLDISTSILSYGEFDTMDNWVGSEFNKNSSYNVFSYIGIGKKIKNDFLYIKLGYQHKNIKYESWAVVPNPIITKYEKTLNHVVTKLSFEKSISKYKSIVFAILFNTGVGIDISSAKNKKVNYYFISIESFFNYTKIGFFIELPLSLWRSAQRPTGSFFSLDIGIRYSIN